MGCRERAGRKDSKTYLLSQAEDVCPGKDPMMSRDELDVLLGEVQHLGEGKTSSQSLATGTMAQV